MSEVLKAIETRRSIRKYKPDTIPKDVLEQILKAGTYAATGRGLQAPIIVAVTNKELRDRLSKMNAAIMGNPEADPFYGAPVVLIVLADKSHPTYVYDGSLVMGNLMLAAHALGIGSCWIHRTLCLRVCGWTGSGSQAQKRRLCVLCGVIAPNLIFGACSPNCVFEMKRYARKQLKYVKKWI